MVDPHYIWALGHIVVLSSSIRILYAYTIGIFSKTVPGLWYRTTYAGTLLSYVIVIYKTLGVPAPTSAYFQRAITDDNAQYGLLALYWALTRPVYLSIVPFATFSLFHVLTFIKSNVLPKIFRGPAPPPSQSSANNANLKPSLTPTGERYVNLINRWVKDNFTPAMRFVSYSEIVILGWSVVRVITRQGSFLAPVFLMHFLRLRYASSAFTRDAIHTVASRIDALAAGQSPVVQNVWTKVKALVHGWASSIMPIAQYHGNPAGAGAGSGQSTGQATGVNAGAGGANVRARANAAR